MAGLDITEGLPLNIGNPAIMPFWNNTAETYDVAIGGTPFFLAPTDVNPYGRGTAPYKKDQFDSSKEPGEQSLTGWWIRSQSSFHAGAGIKFYDPSSGETIPYRFFDSQGIDVWTRGQATLLKDVTEYHITTGTIISATKAPQQHLASIQWTTSGVTYQGVLLHDEYDVDKIDSDGNLTNFIDYNLGTADKVYAICNDGTTAYWVTNDTGPSGKLQVWKKDLALDSGTAGTMMFNSATITVTSAVMEFVKDRIVMCVNNVVYEVAPNATALPTAIYTNPNTSYVYTSVSASGPAIYTAGISGLYSTVQKYTLVASTGAMPVLSSASVAAEFPTGEMVYKLFHYLGYMMIGTNKGVRVAEVNDQDGSLNYGPLIIESEHPVYDFTARDKYVWCATGVENLYSGVSRIDLSSTIEGEPLRFAYANDLQQAHAMNFVTTGVTFIGNTNRLAYTIASSNAGTRVTNKELTANVATLTTLTPHTLIAGDKIWVEGVDATFNSTSSEYTIISVPTTTTLTYAKTAGNVASTAVTATTAIVNNVGHVYLEHPTRLVPYGYLKTGAIRFGTLEPKHYKFIRARGEYVYGEMTIEVIDEQLNQYSLITYNNSTGSPEAATNVPDGSREYLSYNFTLSRSASNDSQGPTFKGYQIKALPATKRQRLIQFPVWCFDVESDRYKVMAGYEGRAWERIQTLEDIESAGDIVNVQDFTTGERIQGIIENVSFSRKTPPSDRYDGFGGLLTITIRTVL